MAVNVNIERDEANAGPVLSPFFPQVGTSQPHNTIGTINNRVYWVSIHFFAVETRGRLVAGYRRGKDKQSPCHQTSHIGQIYQGSSRVDCSLGVVWQTWVHPLLHVRRLHGLRPGVSLHPGCALNTFIAAVLSLSFLYTFCGNFKQCASLLRTKKVKSGVVRKHSIQ